MEVDANPWAVICVNPSQERGAQDALDRAGYTSLFPRHRVRVSRAGRRYWRLFPLFPGYAFLQLPVLDWHHLQLISGVWGWVKNEAGAPAEVGARTIGEISARLGSRGYATLPPAERFELGAKVKFSTRTLADLVGYYAGRSKRIPGYVMVDYDFFGRMIPVEVSEGSLVAAA